MKPAAPCMGCEEREVGCHATCPRYIQYQKENRDFVEAKFKRTKLTRELMETKDHCVRSVTHGKRKRGTGGMVKK